MKGAYKRMAHLVVGHDAALLLAHDPILLLLAHQNHFHCLKQILLGYCAAAMLNRVDGCFVHHVGQVGAHCAGGGQGNLLKVHALIQKHVFGVDLKYVDTPVQVRLIHDNTAVKTSRTEQSRVQDLRAVGGCQNQKSLGGIEAVHLGKKLVQGLLTLVIASHTAVTAAANGIDLINENDTGGIFCCVLKQVADTGCTHTHEHFHKIGTRQGIEWHMGLTCHRFCKKGLTCSGRAYQQSALGELGANLGVFTGIVKEVHDLGQGFLGLILPGHILKGDAGLLLHIHLGIALANPHDSAAAHPLHGKVHEEQQEQEGHRIIQEDQQQGAGVILLLVGIHIVLQEPVHKLIVPRHLYHIVIQILGILGIA